MSFKYRMRWLLTLALRSAGGRFVSLEAQNIGCRVVFSPENVMAVSAVRSRMRFISVAHFDDWSSIELAVLR